MREMPSLAESVVIVTGLPRSGTSMFMQMLVAGGMPVLTDSQRRPDEDNPRGYLEFEPVKQLLKDSKWLAEQGRGKAIKIVSPLLPAVPAGLPCRIILTERNLDEVLDSQERMLARRNKSELATPHRRKVLKEEYQRTTERVKTMIARRPATDLLVLEYSKATADPFGTAARVNAFLGGGFDVDRMAAAIDPALYRNRA